MEHPPTELDLLRAELATVRQELKALSERVPKSGRQPSARVVIDDGDSDVAGEEPGGNRRRFLRLAGAAAVGATAAAIASSSGPAAAITGGNMLIGQANAATSTNDTTVLFAPSAANLDDQTFLVQNFSLGGIAPPSTHRVAVAGTTSGVDGTNGIRTGVYGRTAFTVASPAGLGGQGVFGGAGGSTDNGVFASAFHFGVVGTGPADGYGVMGYSPVGTGAVGVLGRADEGIGIIAASSTGLSLLVRDGGRMQQQLRAVGAPAVGSFSIGEMIRDGRGDMYICTASGAPGTWRKVTAQHPAFADAGARSTCCRTRSA